MNLQPVRGDDLHPGEQIQHIAIPLANPTRPITAHLFPVFAFLEETVD